MPIVTYEEMIRIQRANGLRTHEKNCGMVHSCNPYGTDEERYKGKTYEDVSKEPILPNRVCAHTKVIVPVNPTIIVTENVKQINVNPAPAGYRVVDYNPCDGRDGVLNTIPKGMDTEISHAETVEEYGMTVEDTIYSEPYPVKTVKRKVQETTVEQPITTNADTAEVQTTEDGKQAEKEEITA